VANVAAMPEVVIEVGEQMLTATPTIVRSGPQWDRLHAAAVAYWPDILEYQTHTNRTFPLIVWYPVPDSARPNPHTAAGGESTLAVGPSGARWEIHTSAVRASWNVQRRVAVEEADWLQLETCVVDGHHRPVFGPREVREPEGVPYDDVLAVDVVIRRDERRQPRAAWVLVNESAC
jgi:F420H(2)-dependent quinone reductase